MCVVDGGAEYENRIIYRGETRKIRSFSGEEVYVKV